MGGKTGFFRYIDDEESLNDFFSSLLAWSLEDDPTVLNAIHDDIQFDSQAEVIATQRDGLPRHVPGNSRSRTLDWVVRDSTKIVGYESKTGTDVPKKTQLSEEQSKLELNSNGLNCYLYTVTEHNSDPTDTEVAKWVSWYDVGARINSLDADNKAIEMLQAMAQHEGYDKFRGFEEFKQSGEWIARHEDQLIDLVFEVNRHLEHLEVYTDSNVPQHTTKRLHRAKRKSYDTLNQAYHVFPFHPTGEPEYIDENYYPCIFAPAIENQVSVYMNINVWEERESRRKLLEMVKNNKDSITDMVADYEMSFLASSNSLNHGDKEISTYNGHEIPGVIEDKIGNDRWKRLFIGWDIDTEQDPDNVVTDCVNRVRQLHGIFFGGSEYVPKMTDPLD